MTTPQSECSARALRNESAGQSRAFPSVLAPTISVAAAGVVPLVSEAGHLSAPHPHGQNWPKEVAEAGTPGDTICLAGDDDADERARGKDQPAGGFLPWAFVCRIVGLGILGSRPTCGEQRKLCEHPTAITSVTAQRLLCWRRAMLWFAGAVLIYKGVLGLYQAFEAIAGQPEFVRRALVVAALVPAASIVGPALVIVAALLWKRHWWSARLALSGWLMIFLAPFLFAVIPLTWVIDYPPEMTAEEIQGFKLGLGVTFGLIVTLSTLPSLFGIYPGLTRAIITAKTLAPELPAAGWLLLLVIPVYSLYLLTLSIAVNQVLAAPLLIGAVLCLALAPLGYLGSRSLFAASTFDEMASGLPRLRWKMRMCTLAGLTLLAAFAVTNETLHGWLRGSDPVQLALECGNFVLGVLANICLVAVVGADALTTALAHWQRQQAEPTSAPLKASLDRRVRELRQSLGG